MNFHSDNCKDAIDACKEADRKVRKQQIVQGAEVMALALRSNATVEGEALAQAVEAIARAAVKL